MTGGGLCGPPSVFMVVVSPSIQSGVRAPSAGLAGPHRAAFVALGTASLAFGGLGVVVPGLPTTIFLILASWFFARSNPRLAQKLIRENPVFKPFVKYLDGAPMPIGAKVGALSVMWAAVAVSTWVLWGEGWSAGRIGAVTCVAAAVVGTAMILAWGRRPAASR